MAMEARKSRRFVVEDCEKKCIKSKPVSLISNKQGASQFWTGLLKLKDYFLNIVKNRGWLIYQFLEGYLARELSPC